MSNQGQGEDRSMSEILSSIRRIVTDEERTRREADEDRRRHETDGGASVFVLTDQMRDPDAPVVADAASVDFDKPLELGAPEAVPASASSAPEMRSASDFSDPALTAEDVEDIVRRVVREELQGPIGKQISSKVRKMIREEIARAMDEDDDEPLI